MWLQLGNICNSNDRAIVVSSHNSQHEVGRPVCLTASKSGNPWREDAKRQKSGAGTGWLISWWLYIYIYMLYMYVFIYSFIVICSDDTDKMRNICWIWIYNWISPTICQQFLPKHTVLRSLTSLTPRRGDFWRDIARHGSDASNPAAWSAGNWDDPQRRAGRIYLAFLLIGGFKMFQVSTHLKLYI